MRLQWKIKKGTEGIVLPKECIKFLEDDTKHINVINIIKTVIIINSYYLRSLRMLGEPRL